MIPNSTRFLIERFGWLAFKWSRSYFSVANRCAVVPRVARAETDARFVFDHDALRVAHVRGFGRELMAVGFERSARVGR